MYNRVWNRWSTTQHYSVDMSHICVGATTDQDVQMSLEEESQQHGDLVQGDFLDTYRNLSYKAIMGSLWVAEFCGQAEFVVKIDDDCFLDLYEVKYVNLL